MTVGHTTLAEVRRTYLDAFTAAFAAIRTDVKTEAFAASLAKAHRTYDTAIAESHREALRIHTEALAAAEEK